MLLLLLTPKFPLSEAFDFSQGNILQPRNKLILTGKENYCHVIYPGDISTCDKKIDINKLTLINLPKPIKYSKILKKEDYLISAKGGIKGFSLYNTLKNSEEADTPLAASNNLIVVRPKEEALRYNTIQYLHNLLDLVVQRLRDEREKESPEDTKNQQLITIRRELLPMYAESPTDVSLQL